MNERHRVNITVDGDKAVNKSWQEMKVKDIKKNVKKVETKQPVCPVSAQKRKTVDTNIRQNYQYNMDAELEKEVKAKLEALVANQDDNARVQFSTDLSAGDRFRIHEMAEKMGLFTLSLGEGTYRYISVYKKPKTDQNEMVDDTATMKHINSS